MSSFSLQHKLLRLARRDLRVSICFSIFVHLILLLSLDNGVMLGLLALKEFSNLKKQEGRPPDISSKSRSSSPILTYRKIKQPQSHMQEERNGPKNQQWRPPPPGWFKVNVDAAIMEDQNKEGLGVVVRNSEGKCTAAAMKPAEFHGSIAFAEAEATKFGLEIAEQAGCLPLIVETDSQEVVDLVLNRKGTRKEIFWLISEIQAILLRMQQSKLQHVLRSGNSAVHSLAKLSLKQDSVFSWLENIPESILSVITDFEK